MNKSFIFPLILAIFLGFLCSKIVYAVYNPEIKESYNSYFVQSGVYSNEKVLNEEIKKLEAYTLMEEDNKTYVYVGITTSMENANKIKETYKNMGINTYIKKKKINSIEFLRNLEQYDILVNSVSKQEDLISILNVILSTYEESLEVN